MASRPERKQVTALFSDLGGYTALSERFEPEDVQEIIGEFFEHAARIVAGYGGRLDKLMGDGVMAVFGDPVTHEDDAERAVRAALDLHTAVADTSSRVAPRIGREIALHSGVASGVALIGDELVGLSTGPVGDPINVASRLQSLANSGQVLIAPETHRLTAGIFVVRDLGPHEVKGKAEPIHVTEVCGIAPARTRPVRKQGKFVGRQEELGLLLAAAEQLRDGRSGVITVSGEAGSGKTRLFDEFRSQLGDDVVWLQGRAYPYGQNIAYLPVVEMISASIGIEVDDTTETIGRKLTDAVEAALGPDDPALAALARLYDIDVPGTQPIDRESFPEALLDAIHRLIEIQARLGPTVLCVQDLHWADPSTVGLLRGLVSRLEAPLLTICNFRPGFVLEASNERALVLAELSERQTRQLLQSLLDDTSPPDELQTSIDAHTDGNPFFVEEIVNSLIETGTLVRTNGSWELSRPLSEAKVPATIRGVIGARIDRLDDHERRLLREAAVVGREFLYRVVAAVTTVTDDVGGCLSRLELADLIRQKSSDELEYLFKHALTQEVAYDGMVKADRQQLHERVASAIESILGDRIGELVETLAFHYTRANVPDKAVHYLIEAGKKSTARYALSEATAHFQQAHELLVAGPQSLERDRALAELVVAWSLVHYYDGTIADWLRLSEAHLDAAERCGDVGVLAMYLGWMGNAQWLSGDLHRSVATLERAEAAAREAGDARALAYVESWLTWTRHDLGLAAEVADRGLPTSLSDEEIRAEPYPWFKGHGGLAQAAITAGRHPMARRICDDLLAFAASSGSARAEFIAYSLDFYYWYMLLDAQRALESARRAVAAARDPCYGALGAMALAGAQSLNMEFDEAAQLLDEWLPRADACGNVFAAEGLRFNRGAIDVASGSLSRGLRRMCAARDAAAKRGYLTGVFWNELGLARIYVAAALRQGPRPSLGVIVRNPWFVFTQALPAARKARRLLEQLRATAVERRWLGGLYQIDLFRAQLLAHEGDREAAREALDSVRRSLTEAGVDETAEIKELARELA